MLARLLGMPLLRVRADVLLVPVRLRDEMPPSVPSAAGPTAPRGALPSVVASRSPASGGSGLAEAQRLVVESERDLRALPPTEPEG